MNIFIKILNYYAYLKMGMSMTYAFVMSKRTEINTLTLLVLLRELVIKDCIQASLIF